MINYLFYFYNEKFNNEEELQTNMNTSATDLSFINGNVTKIWGNEI